MCLVPSIQIYVQQYGKQPGHRYVYLVDKVKYRSGYVTDINNAAATTTARHASAFIRTRGCAPLPVSAPRQRCCRIDDCCCSRGSSERFLHLRRRQQRPWQAGGACTPKREMASEGTMPPFTRDQGQGKQTNGSSFCSSAHTT